MRLGGICLIPYDDSSCVGTRFESLWKPSEIPIHFCVVDPAKEAADPAYSPFEVYQCSFQQGDTLKRDDEIFDKATKALMTAYGNCVTPEDYWYAEREFKELFKSGVIKSETYIWARISTGKVVYHVDGTDEGSVVFTDANVPAGAYAVPDKAFQAALADTCNLNDHYGESPSTGFTGWFTDKGLTAPYRGSELSAGDELHLYARNRLTFRCAFTDDSVDTTELVLRTSPESTAPLAESWTLPDFGLSDEKHSLNGIGLPAIGDDGPAHKALYLGESVTLARPMGRVYARMGDGTWAGFRAVAWLASQNSDSQMTKVTPTRDTCVYMRVERADYDGVSSTKN